MSTSPTFKYRGPDKRCPFPFNRDAATSPGVEYDYVDLTASGGDEGLAEACRLWWLLESFGATYSASISATVGIPPSTFGVDVAAVSLTHTSAAPSDRCSDFRTPILNSYSEYVSSTATGTASNTEASARLSMYVAYVSSKWRLYYAFSMYSVADLSGGGDSVRLISYLTNAASLPTGFTSITSRTISFDAYTLNAKWARDVFEGPVGYIGPVDSGSSVTLTFSPTFYTLV